MLESLKLAITDWKTHVAKFVDDAHEFAGFDIPDGCDIFPAADLDSKQIEQLKNEKEKAENPTMNLSKRREPILKKFIAAIRKNAELERDNPLLEEIVSLKAKIEELTEKHQKDMKHNVCLAQNVQNLIKKQKETQKALDDKIKCD